METEADEPLRRWRQLREMLSPLEPRPESVERIVRGALAGPPADRRPARSPRLVPAVAGLAALLALAVLAGILAPRPRAVASIENVGEMLIVRHGKESEGGRWRIHNGNRGAGSPPSGSIIVIHGGAR
jgi:hypothetical protein